MSCMEKEKRGFFTLNLISLTFTLGMIVLVLLGLGAVVILPLILTHLGLADVTDRLFRYTRWPICSPPSSLDWQRYTALVRAAAARVGSGYLLEPSSPPPPG